MNIDSLNEIRRFEIFKVSEFLYHGIVFDAKGSVEWESESPMSSNDLAKFLHQEYSFHQLDIHEKLSVVNPKKYFSNMEKELSMAKKITKNSNDYDDTIVKQLQGWLNRIEN